MCALMSRRVSTSLLPLLALALIGHAYAGGPILESGNACLRPSSDDQAPRVTVRMYDYALAPANIVQRAQDVARQIVRETGIETDWFNCRISENDPRVSDGGCGAAVASSDVALRLLPDRMAKAAGLRASIYGFAKPPFIAFVFFDRVADLAASGAVEEPHVILGHLLAHELGHLLLGRNSHSRKGIMQIPWDDKELKLAEQGRLLFTDGQAQRMCLQAFTRMQADLASSSTELFQAEAEGFIGSPSDPMRHSSSKTACGQCR